MRRESPELFRRGHAAFEVKFLAARLPRGARDAHQPASFCDGDATGPVMTDVVALLVRGTCFRAPFKNSISNACLPTSRSSAAMRAS